MANARSLPLPADAVTPRELFVAIGASSAVHVLLLAAIPVVFETRAEPDVRFDRVDLTLVRPDRPKTEEEPKDEIELPSEPSQSPVEPRSSVAVAKPLPRGGLEPKKAPAPSSDSKGSASAKGSGGTGGSTPGSPAGVTGLPLAEGLPGTGWNVPVGEGGDWGMKPVEVKPRAPARQAPPATKAVAAVRRPEPPPRIEPERREVEIVERARPPGGLEFLARRHYPAAALKAGQSGVARLLVRIHPDGSATVVRPMSRSEYGFEDACRRVLADAGRWEPPRDEDGNAVAALVRFVCRFNTSMR